MSKRQQLAEGLRWVGWHFPTILLGVVYTCVIYMGFTALSNYTDRHGLFPQPWGGITMAITVDGLLLFSVVAFWRSERSWRSLPAWTAGLLLVTAAVTTYTLQRWHAELVAGQPHAWHPLILAGIVPAAMVLVTLAWHLIRPVHKQEPTERGDGLTVLPLPPEAVANMAGIEERKKRSLPDRTLATNQRTNGAGNPRQRAMVVLREQPELKVPEVAAAARVSERTVRNAKADLAREGS